MCMRKLDTREREKEKEGREKEGGDPGKCVKCVAIYNKYW